MPKEYSRPALCLICSYPVLDTGVPVSELDPKRLGNWWVRQEWLPKLELDAVADFLSSQICQFCLWNARSMGETAMEVEEVDWWTGHDNNKFYQQFFYQDAVISPCAVKISQLAGSEIKSESTVPEQVNLEVANNIKQESDSVDTNTASSLPYPHPVADAPTLPPSIIKTEMIEDLEPGDCCNEERPNSVDPQESGVSDGQLTDGDDQDFEDSPNNVGEENPDDHPQSTSRCQSVYPYQFTKHPSHSKCAHCGKEVMLWPEMFRHLSNVHKYQKTYVCSTCFAHFSNVDEKEEHENTHKLFQCHECGHRDDDMNVVWNHYLKLHPARAVPRPKPVPVCVEEVPVSDPALQIRVSHRIRKRKYSTKFTETTDILESTEKVVKCCNNVYREQIQLRCHLFPQFKALYKCNYCSKSFVDQLKRVKHIQSCHSTIAFKCDFLLCRKYFPNSNNKLQHMSKEHKHGALYRKCPYCPCRMKKRYLLGHIIGEHRAQAIWCSTSGCSRFFHSKSELKLHERLHNQLTRFSCLYCEKQFPSKLRLYFHTTSFHRNVMIPCVVTGCPELFESVDDREPHHRIMHSDSEVNSIYCNQCDFKANCESLVLTHAMISHGKFSMDCHHCGLVFVRRNNFKFHSHAPECKNCKATLPCPTLLKSHLLECNLSFRLSHMSICIYCNAVFVSNALLHEHVKKVHSFEMNLCETDDCFAYFKHPAELKLHSDLAHGQKRYDCEMCGAAAQSHQLLKKHVINFHRGFGVHCPFCPQYFHFKKTYAKHMLTVHYIKT